MQNAARSRNACQIISSVQWTIFVAILNQLTHMRSVAAAAFGACKMNYFVAFFAASDRQHQ
jgi:hypothetical protein